MKKCDDTVSSFGKRGLWIQRIDFILIGILSLSSGGLLQAQEPGRTAGSKAGRTLSARALSQALSEFNRGAAWLEQYQYSEAAGAFEQVLEAAPDWTAAWFNLGLARLNLMEKSGTNSLAAKRAFETVLAAHPGHLHAQFCLGLHYQYLREYEKALGCFQAVCDKDAQDPNVWYKCAEMLLSLGKDEEGTKALETTVALDPGFISAFYRLALQYQRKGQSEKAKSLFERFSKLKSAELTGGTFVVHEAYGTAGKYYLALGADNLPLPQAEPPPPGRILFSPETKSLDTKITPWKVPGGDVTLPGIAVADVDGDGDLDVCLTATGADGETSIWINDGAGTFSRKSVVARQGISPCFGDVDNDGDVDLWLGGAAGDRLFLNDGKGNFQERPVSSPAETNGITSRALLLDWDSDGDLDLLAFHLRQGAIPVVGRSEPAPAHLWRNNTDGSFTNLASQVGLALTNHPVSAVVFDDFDNDRDLDLVICFADDQAPLAWVNDRIASYHLLDNKTIGLSLTNVLSATTGDYNKDGNRDLLVFTGQGPCLYRNLGGFRFQKDADFSRSFGSLGGTGGQFADMDNDGDLDIVIADAARRNGDRGPTLLINDWPRPRFLNVLEIDPGHLLAAIKTPGNASCVAADFNGDGKCDLLLAAAGQAPVFLENLTLGGHWIQLDLRGARPQDKKTRSNYSAIGARIDLKTGNLSQQFVVGTPAGPVGMSPLRIHAGLGPHNKVDWLRILWPDAVLQAELELAGDQIVTLAELQRKSSSCPHLFAWDGSHFAFIADFGGMGGLGYLVAPGQYAQPDPTEYVPVPNLQPRDGGYVLQVLEPLEEIVYFDEAKLIAVDHPLGTTVYPHEMMAVNAPPTPFEVFCFSDRIQPVRAVDHRGGDVTDPVLRIDRYYAGATEVDPRFAGYARDHFVEVDFGDRLQRISSRRRLVLFLYGWVEYSYSSSNFAADQAGLRLKAPSIQVYRNGAWVEIFQEVGYPAGLQHMMTLDVTGKILPSDQRIRITSNMELFWDQIFIAPLLDAPQLVLKEVPVKSADLHFLGYPREYSPDGRLPNLYDYSNIDRTQPWNMMRGSYTRFGDVAELLQTADDCYVVMGRGEELTLCFPVEAFGPVPANSQRTFILKTDSYCKDMDLYTAFPDTVEPLPFHGMSRYPYPIHEQYPQDPKRKEFLKRFNTRFIGGGL